MIKDVALKTVRQELFELYKVPEFVGLYETNKDFADDFLDLMAKADYDDLEEEYDIGKVKRVSVCCTSTPSIVVTFRYYGQDYWCGGCGRVFSIRH